MAWSTKIPTKPGGRFLVTVYGTVRQADLVEKYGGGLQWIVLPECSHFDVASSDVTAWQRQPKPFGEVLPTLASYPINSSSGS